MAAQIVPATPITPFEYIVDDGPPFGPVLFRPLVYVFEHVMLPQMYFSGHPEVARALQGKQTLGVSFVHFWSKSAVFCESNGMWPPNTTEDADAYVAYASALWSLMACVPTRDHDFTVWSIRTPVPKAVGEAYFVALCQPTEIEAHQVSNVGARRCFTLESTFEDGMACFCEWTQDGEHKNHGTVSRQTSDGFTRLVLAHLRGPAV